MQVIFLLSSVLSLVESVSVEGRKRKQVPKLISASAQLDDSSIWLQWVPRSGATAAHTITNEMNGGDKCELRMHNPKATADDEVQLSLARASDKTIKGKGVVLLRDPCERFISAYEQVRKEEAAKELKAKFFPTPEAYLQGITDVIKLHENGTAPSFAEASKIYLGTLGYKKRAQITLHKYIFVAIPTHAFVPKNVEFVCYHEQQLRNDVVKHLTMHGCTNSSLPPTTAASLVEVERKKKRTAVTVEAKGDSIKCKYAINKDMCKKVQELYVADTALYESFCDQKTGSNKYYKNRQQYSAFIAGGEKC